MSKLSVDTNVHWRSRGRVQLVCEDESWTQQHFKDDCDVNLILKKFGHGAFVDPRTVSNTYGDFTDVDDYQSALNKVIAADEAFMALPSAVRTRFGNDPAQFIEFVSDDSNRDEMKKLGLLREDIDPPVLPPMEVVIVDKKVSIQDTPPGST